MESVKQKQCSKCYEFKPLLKFYKHSNHKDGHQSRCKACQDKINQKYRIHKVNGKAYYQANKEKFLKYSSDYRLKNKETEKYKKRKKEYAKKWRKENVMEARMNSRNSSKKYRKLNAEKVKVYMKIWRRTFEGKISDIKKKQKRKASLRNCIINDLTSKQIQILLTRARQCVICNKLFNKKRKKTLDHIIPLAKNGNNTLMNIQVVCEKCNCKKATRDYTEFNGGQILMFV